MKRFFSIWAVTVGGLLVLTSLSFGQHGHGGTSMGSMKMESKEVVVEGVKVVFQMMTNEEHKKMMKDMKMKGEIEPGTTHIIGVTLKDEKTQKEITDAEVNMKVVDPKGKDQVKGLKFEEMMKSFEAFFNLPEKGKYQVMVLFKVGDKKRTAGVYWDIM